MSPRRGFTEIEPGLSGIAVIYARYSSHAQREVSIEQQVEECRKYALRNGLRVVEVYADKAVSGKTDHRPNFQRMMRDAEKNKFAYVIAWKSNRISRNMFQSLVNESKLNDMGIKVLYTEENFDDTAAGRFALRNMMNVNQFYVENMAEDIMRGLMDNAKHCKVNNGGLPLGYKKGEDGRYAIDAQGARLVQEIYTRFLADEAFIDIANDFNARGLKTSRGNPWNKGSFHRMLSNEIYTGVYKYSSVRIEGGVPAIIDKETFYAVQNKLKTKKNAQGRHRMNGDYLLTGKLFCGHCGALMVGISGTSRHGGKHYYYICQNKRINKACDKKNVRRDYIEQRVTELTKEYIMRDDVIEWIADSTVKYQKSLKHTSILSSLEDNLSEVNRSIKNLLTAIEQGVITSTTKERMQELESEKKDLSHNIAIEKAANMPLEKDKIIFWLESFRSGDTTDKKYQAHVIDTFIHAVYLHDDKIEIEYYYTGKDDPQRLKAQLDDSAGTEGSSLSGVKTADMQGGSYKLSLSPPNEHCTNTRSFKCGFAVKVWL